MFDNVLRMNTMLLKDGETVFMYCYSFFFVNAVNELCDFCRLLISIQYNVVDDG